jgi:hypothetical protein
MSGHRRIGMDIHMCSSGAVNPSDSWDWSQDFIVAPTQLTLTVHVLTQGLILGTDSDTASPTGPVPSLNTCRFLYSSRFLTVGTF